MDYFVAVTVVIVFVVVFVVHLQDLCRSHRPDPMKMVYSMVPSTYPWAEIRAIMLLSSIKSSVSPAQDGMMLCMCVMPGPLGTCILILTVLGRAPGMLQPG